MKLNEVYEALTEEQFDEKAGKKALKFIGARSLKISELLLNEAATPHQKGRIVIISPSKITKYQRYIDQFFLK